MKSIECTRRRWVLPSTLRRCHAAYTLACLVFLAGEAGAQARRTEAPASRRSSATVPKRAAERTAARPQAAARTPAKAPATAPATAVAAAAGRGPDPASTAPRDEPAGGRTISPGTIPLRAASRAQVRTAPDGPVIGTVEGAGTVLPIARERGWVRVRIEGWVREADLLPVDSTLRTALTAADLRADPDGSKGKLVRWKVEILAFQRADALRRDLTLGEPYLLARGPAGENALLYLAIPSALAAEAQALAPLTVIQITARVRNGRSAPTNVPILDIETIARP